MKLKSNPFLRFRPSSLAISAVLSFAGFSTQSALADATWVGDSTQDWNTAANWSSDPANPTGNFFINTVTAGVFPILSANSGFTPVDLIIANAGTLSGRVDHRAGSLSLANVAATGGNWFFVGRGANTANGTYNLANTGTAGGGISGFAQGSGSLTVGKLWVGGASFFEGGIGKVNINTTGTITANSTENVAAPIVGTGAGSSGTVNLESGTVQANAELWVGNTGTGVFNQSGGTTNSTSYFVIGRSGSGTYTLTGGTVNAATTTGVATIASTQGVSGTLAASGGTFNSTNGLLVGEAFFAGSGTATGILNLSGTGVVNTGTNTTTGVNLGTNANADGTVNLNGGTLQTARIQKGAGTGSFNFNGGTLKATATNSTNFMTGLTTATVQAGGAIVDSNGFDVTIGQDLADGGGGLTKNGAGTLTLAGAAAYTGATTVSTGTLGFSTKQSSVGSISVAASTDLRSQAFDTSSTPLTSTSLALATGSTLTFDFNLLNVGLGTPLISTGTLTTSGTVNVAIANGASLTTGVHKLLSYSSFGGTLANFSGSPFTLGARGTGTLTLAGSALNLSVTANSPKWTGLDTGNWVVGATGANKNWRLITGLAATDYIQGDTVLFDESAAGTANILISAADVTPAATTFNNNATKSYTLGGAFAIAGTGSLTKNNVGSLVITNTNTYTGTTTIGSGATLTLGDGTTGHDGSIAGTSGVANEGTLLFNRFGASTGPYPITGAGSVVKNGAGTQTLSGASSYTGGTTVNAGALSIGANNNLGDATSAVTLNGGTLRTTAGITNTHPFTIGAGGGTINVTTAGQYFFDTFDTLQGSGALAVTGTGTLTANVGNLRVAKVNTYNGPITVNSGGIFEYGVVGAVDAASTFTVGNEGEVSIQNATAMLNAVTVSGGTNSVLSFENGGTGEVSGPVTLNANAIVGLRDWYNNATVRGGIISGLVSGTGGLTVNSGTGNGGLLTLSNAANSYAGGTTLNASRVLASSSSALGTGAVAIGGTNARLELANGVNVANPITINAGAGTAALGVIWVPTLNDSATVSGPITINAVPAAGGLFAANGGTLTVTGPITSSVPVTVRLGTVLLTNTTSTYTAMQIISGTAKVGATNAIPVAVAPILGSGGVTGTLDLGGFNQTLAGITQSVNAGAGSIITNSGGSDSTLTTTGTSTYIGVIQNGATNKVALNVSSGALTLGGVNNTFTGNITVSGGLTLADNAQLKFTPGPNTLVNSIGGAGTLNVDGDFVIDTAGASVANGNTWTLVNVGTLNETFSATFSVVGFTETANVWTKVDGANTWTFSEATGVLSLAVGGGSGYSAWATANAPGQTKDQDHDNDGVKNGIEYFMGLSGSGFTANPALSAGTVTWTKGGTYTGTYGTDFVVQSSADLVTWTDVPVGSGALGTVVDGAGSVSYTPPTGQTKRFGRLVVNN